jgi:NAD(P)-dependent dehydrogenase (short-subunit alcohol dehydrogenase family)
MADFTGKAVIVTGANGGLGGAVTRAFLDAGADVIGVSHRWGGEMGDQRRLVRLETDLTVPAGSQRLAEAAASFGRGPDVLVHLVGGFAGGQRVEATPDESWERMLGLNLGSAFRVFRAVLPGMLEAGRGRIVAAGSRAGLEPAAGMSAYCASKAALHMLVRCLAAETGASGVTVNAVLPSVIDTPANRQAMPSADFSRWVRPEAVAGLILWLAGDEAAGVNGALIPIYGRA